MKGKEDPIALSDEEYPDWLWGCLSETKKAGGEGGVGGEGGGDLFCMFPSQYTSSIHLSHLLKSRLV